MLVATLRFCGLAGRRNHHCRQTILRGQLAEIGQFMALQTIPLAQHLSALPLELLELLLFGFGWSRIRGAQIHRQKRPFAVHLRRIGQRVFIGADGQIYKLIPHRDQFLIEIVSRGGNGFRAGVLRQSPLQAENLRAHVLNLIDRVVHAVEFVVNLHLHGELLLQIGFTDFDSRI